MQEPIYSLLQQLRTQRAHQVIVAGLSLLLSAGLSGCSNDDNERLPGSDGSGEAALVFPTDILVTEFDSTPMTRANGEPEKETTSFNVDDNQGVIIDTGKGDVDEQESSVQTRAITVTTGVHYRVVIYKSGESAIYSQFEFVAGTATPIGGNRVTVEVGNYQIFAYSFNNTNSIPELSADSNISVSDGNDFMTTNVISQSITTDQIFKTINLSQLTFQRRCCKVWVKVESIAYDDTAINDCNVTLGKLSASATWNLKSSSSFTGVSGETTWSAISNKSSAKNTPITASHIMIPISGLSLSLPTATFNTNKNSSKGIKEFSFSGKNVPAISFTSGNQYLIQLRGMGAYVPTTPGPVSIGGYKWSAYNSTSGKGFVSNPWDYGYYYSASGAPSACPTGWHTPSIEELGVLPSKVIPKGSYVLINSNVYQILNDKGFFGSSSDANSGNIFKDGDQILCLPAAGYLDTGSGNKGNKEVGKCGSYWSDTSGSSGYGRYLENSASVSITRFTYNPQYGRSVRCLQ